jgi:hypothetical protein
MLDGAAQPEGDGITITVPRTDVTDVAVGRFPRFGIAVFGSSTSLVKASTTLDRVYAGIDPAGAAAPNFRGIAASTTWGLFLTNSNASRNRASGLAVYGGYLNVRNSRFESNGASGIYLAGYTRAEVIGNVLAHNHDFGVGLDAYQRGVQLSGNSISDNARGGIDVGLDGPTANVADDSRRQPNYPLIESVHYDAAKQQTTIKLLVATQMPPPVVMERDSSLLRISVEVYANGTPDGQAERLVGSADAYEPREITPQELTLTVNGDLRGQWLTAIAFRIRTDCYYDNCTGRPETSEISPAVYVP